MPDPLTLEHFVPHVGEEFQFHFDGASPSSVTLIEASALPTSGDPRRMRAPFSLIFRDASPHVWPQALYPVEHKELGAHEIFVVPLEGDPTGVTYQAVFN